jgi:peptidoglycan hydrolase CwlO-like protein
MDYIPLVVLFTSFLLHTIGLLSIYRGAGSVMNKFGIGFLAGAIIGATSLAVMYLSESFFDVLSQPIISIITPYLVIFAALLIFFVILILLWLKIANKIYAVNRKTKILQQEIAGIQTRIDTIAADIADKNRIIAKVNTNISERDKKLIEITKNSSR